MQKEFNFNFKPLARMSFCPGPRYLSGGYLCGYALVHALNRFGLHLVLFHALDEFALHLVLFHPLKRGAGIGHALQ